MHQSVSVLYVPAERDAGDERLEWHVLRALGLARRSGERDRLCAPAAPLRLRCPAEHCGATNRSARASRRARHSSPHQTGRVQSAHTYCTELTRRGRQSSAAQRVHRSHGASAPALALRCPLCCRALTTLTTSSFIHCSKPLSFSLSSTIRIF